MRKAPRERKRGGGFASQWASTWGLGRRTPKAIRSSQCSNSAATEKSKHGSGKDDCCWRTAAMTTGLSSTDGSKRAATFNAIGHGSHGTFFFGFGFVPATMVIAEAIDVGFAMGLARFGVGVACAAARTMRVGIAFDTCGSVAMRSGRCARLLTGTRRAGAGRGIAR